MKNTVLITGANRGLGLEFTKQYANKGLKVIACCRNPAKAKQLQALRDTHENIEIEELDITNSEQLKNLSKKINGQSIDILLNNAGIYGGQNQNFEDISDKTFLDTFMANTVSPLNVIRTFKQNLADSELKQVVNITSKMGSISDNTSSRAYAYRASKTALNMLMQNVSIDLAALNIKVLVIHPGWVKTDMGGENALIDSETSIAGMMDVISHKGTIGNLEFYDYSGKHINW